MDDSFDVIVIGGGAVGENVADRTVQGGLKTLIVENELVGGECSYWACMPSKALLRSPQAVRAAHHLEGAAQAVTGDVDVRAVLDRRDSFTSHWKDAGQVSWLNSAGISLLRGHARLSGERQVQVTTPDGTVQTLTAAHAVVISTGSAALVPDIPGLRDARPWTSREATSAQEIPESLVILGGGVVAVEMATAYAQLGSSVTVLVRGSVLSGQESFAGEYVSAGLKDLGVDVRTSVTTLSVKRDGSGVRVETDQGTFTAAEILVATGRTPHSTDVGLETLTGLDDAPLPGQWITVDDTLRVPGSEWLYAVGDVNGRALLTHQGKYQARAAGDAIAARARGEVLADSPWGRHVATADHGAVPSVVFSEPEVASVGLTEASAQAAGHSVRAVDVEFSSVAGASLFEDGYMGKARIVVDTERDVLLGATFVGPGVAELVQGASIAVVGEVPLSRLWHAVPAYPTLSEVWLRLLEAYGRDSA